jgi:transposase
LKGELREVLEPLLKEIESLKERIQEYEERIEKIARENYPQVELLKQVNTPSGYAIFPPLFIRI